MECSISVVLNFDVIVILKFSLLCFGFVLFLIPRWFAFYAITGYFKLLIRKSEAIWRNCKSCLFDLSVWTTDLILDRFRFIFLVLRNDGFVPSYLHTLIGFVKVRPELKVHDPINETVPCSALLRKLLLVDSHFCLEAGVWNKSYSVDEKKFRWRI